MSKTRTPALGFIMITLTLDILGIGLIVPILPGLVKEFTGGDTAAASHAVGWLGALYALMQFVFAPFLGCLSDKVGRRPVLLISQFAMAIDYFFLALAPGLGWFVAGRILTGITGANFSAATAYIADVSPPEKRAANFGFVGMAFGIGFIIGPLLGGVLGHWGLRVPFYAAGILCLANWAYGWFILPESLRAENRRPINWRRANPAGALVHLWHHPQLFGLALCALLSFIAHSVYPSVWVLYTGYRYGWDPLWNSFSLAVVGVFAAFVQGYLTGKVTSLLGIWKTAILGLAVAAVGYAAYGLATSGWMVFIIIGFGSLGGLAGPTVQSLISNSVGDDEQGAIQGAVGSLESVAGILGPLIATSVFSFFIDKDRAHPVPGAPFFAASVIGFLALLAAVLARRKGLVRGEKEQPAAAVSVPPPVADME